MSRFDRELDYDALCDAIDERRRRNRLNSCWCGLDGYPGSCPGPQSCPYSGFNDKDESEDDDASE